MGGSRWPFRWRSGWLGQAMYFDFRDLHRIIRSVVARIGGFACDLFYQLDALGSALAEEVVVAVEMRRRNFGDEELRAVGVWTRVRHCQSTRNVELQIRGELIVETVTGPALARSQWIAALNHEVWNHAMEDSSAVQRDYLSSRDPELHDSGRRSIGNGRGRARLQFRR